MEIIKEERQPKPPVVQGVKSTLQEVDTTQKNDPSRDMLDVRNLRVRIINALMASNESVTDLKMISVVNMMLKDMTSDAVSTMRLKLEEKSADSAEQARMLAAEVMKLVINGKGMQEEIIDVQAKPRTIPELPDHIQTRDFLPGEATQGTIHQTFDEFQAKMGKVDLAAEDAED